ncbi:MAG: hypothetical protein RLZZ480_315 [Candidatus Parcubacteria bacterium]|jgi:hypothetical protein
MPHQTDCKRAAADTYAGLGEALSGQFAPGCER